MLSGRYRTDRLLRHFSDSNDSCALCHQQVPGTIEHLLAQCPTLTHTTNQLLLKLQQSTDIRDTAKTLITESFNSVKSTTQMMLDCSVIPSVISAKQKEGNSLIQELFRFTRSWCYSLHKSRLKLLGRWRN